MTRLDSQNLKKVHTRTINIATYIYDQDAVVVEGELKDDRLIQSFRASGEIAEPGIIHSMIIRILVKGPALVIEDVQVQMPTVPNEVCLETRESLEPILGLPIISGFTMKIKERVGGAKGCAHLLALLTAMAPAAVQGAWTAASTRKRDSADLKQYSMERLKNTCYVWREDGPAFRKYNLR